MFGRRIYLAGGNSEAAIYSGIRVDRIKIIVFMLSGIMAAISGILLSSRLSSAQTNAGMGYELDAIAAVVLGGTSLAGGVGTMVGTILGALIKRRDNRQWCLNCRNNFFGRRSSAFSAKAR